MAIVIARPLISSAIMGTFPWHQGVHREKSFQINSIDSSSIHRGTKQTVSVNICSQDLISPMIFGLKCGEKTGAFFISSNFHDFGKVMPVVLER